MATFVTPKVRWLLWRPICSGHLGGKVPSTLKPLYVSVSVKLGDLPRNDTLEEGAWTSLHIGPGCPPIKTGFAVQKPGKDIHGIHP